LHPATKKLQMYPLSFARNFKSRESCEYRNGASAGVIAIEKLQNSNLFLLKWTQPLPTITPDGPLKTIRIAIHNSTRDGKDCNENRYYILSQYLLGKKFGEGVRRHWAIENN
jgi:hypothetical protein